MILSGGDGLDSTQRTVAPADYRQEAVPLSQTSAQPHIFNIIYLMRSCRHRPFVTEPPTPVEIQGARRGFLRRLPTPEHPPIESQCPSSSIWAAWAATSQDRRDRAGSSQRLRPALSRSRFSSHRVECAGRACGNTSRGEAHEPPRRSRPSGSELARAAPNCAELSRNFTLRPKYSLYAIVFIVFLTLA